MRHMGLAAALALGALSTAASAQSASAGYTGLRVEGQVGYDRTSAHLDYDFAGSVLDLGSTKTSGATYGANVGYDVDFGGFLLGSEASIAWSSSKNCETFLGDRSCFKVGREIEAGIRVGKVLGATGPLVYGKVAYVNGRFQTRDEFADGSPTIRAHDDRGGIRFGGGVEQKLTRTVYVKAEYRYTDYNDYKAVDEDGGVLKLGIDRHQVVGGVGMIF